MPDDCQARNVHCPKIGGGPVCMKPKMEGSGDENYTRDGCFSLYNKEHGRCQPVCEWSRHVGNLFSVAGIKFKPLTHYHKWHNLFCVEKKLYAELEIGLILQYQMVFRLKKDFAMYNFQDLCQFWFLGKWTRVVCNKERPLWLPKWWWCGIFVWNGMHVSKEIVMLGSNTKNADLS